MAAHYAGFKSGVGGRLHAVCSTFTATDIAAAGTAPSIATAARR